MKAASYESKGRARDVLEIGQLPMPQQLADDEVLVRVRASAVNPSDIKGRSGFGGTQMTFPRVVPHQDGAGTIEAVGRNVDRRRVGERVWLHKAQWRRAFGTAAEFVAVPEERAIHLPTAISFSVGACLGVPAITAHRAVTCHGGVRGKRVLVRGLGAVGYYACQWALRSAAASCVVSVRREADVAPAKELGASEVVLAGSAELRSVGSFDRIIEVDLARNGEEDTALLAAHGVVAAYASDSDWSPRLPMLEAMTKNALLAPILVYTIGDQATRAAVDAIQEFLVSDMRHRIALTLPLERIVEAHERQEAGAVSGKIVLEL